jgi:hypothetical protein
MFRILSRELATANLSKVYSPFPSLRCFAMAGN